MMRRTDQLRLIPDQANSIVTVNEKILNYTIHNGIMIKSLSIKQLILKIIHLILELKQILKIKKFIGITVMKFF